MTTDIKAQLRTAAAEIRTEGHDGWGNMADDAIAYIEQLEGQLSAQTAEPYGYVLKTGHGTAFRENLAGVEPDFVKHWVRVYTDPPVIQTEQPSLTITLRQAEELVKFFGGHDCEVTVTGPLSAWEKTEPGLYAYCTEYPEEGASYLGKTEVDDDLAMHGRNVKTEQPSLSDAEILELARGHWHNDAYHGDVCTIRFARALLSAQRQDSDKEHN